MRYLDRKYIALCSYLGISETDEGLLLWSDGSFTYDNPETFENNEYVLVKNKRKYEPDLTYKGFYFYITER